MDDNQKKANDSSKRWNENAFQLGNKKQKPHFGEAFAVWTRLELATSCVTGRHSNQLNYQTI